MKRSRWFIVGFVLVAGLLAYAFVDEVRDNFIIPMIYRFWVFAQIYHAIPQRAYWILLIVVLVYLTITIFYGVSLDEGEDDRQTIFRGPVEGLANAIEERQRGVYFKWRIANLLAEVAVYILNYQERRLPGRRLAGRDWNPPPEVDKYLDAGINTTFADYPSPGRFRPRPVTPLDIDLEPVVAFLESELEMEQHDPQHS